MKGDVTGKPPHLHNPQEPRGHHDPSAAAPIDDAILRNYLADNLPAEELARVEKALRDSAQLRARLEEVRNNREDVQLHTLGAIWHRSRLTCPSRQQLGSYLLDALDPVTGQALHAAADDLLARLARPGPGLRAARRLIAAGPTAGEGD